MTDPQRSHDTTCTCCCKPPVHHVHRRDWRPCPATMRPRLNPRKPAAIWWDQFADAVQHEHTFRAFANDYPTEFPMLADR